MSMVGIRPQEDHRSRKASKTSHRSRRADFTLHHMDTLVVREHSSNMARLDIRNTLGLVHRHGKQRL
jgi:hypothetical protein